MVWQFLECLEGTVGSGGLRVLRVLKGPEGKNAIPLICYLNPVSVLYPFGALGHQSLEFSL